MENKMQEITKSTGITLEFSLHIEFLFSKKAIEEYFDEFSICLSL
jgi:hypothetical protein